AFVDRAVPLRRLCFRDSSPEFADALVMKGKGGAHEDVVTTVRSVETKLTRHLGEIADDVIGLFLRCSARLLSGALDVNSVFVRAGQEISLDASLSFRTCDRVSHDHRVEVTEMRQAVGVIDWCSDVESVHLYKSFGQRGQRLS